jgi:hypothetical protein
VKPGLAPTGCQKPLRRMPNHVEDKLWNRVKRLLPRSHDPYLILLKGHLLIEEQLFAYISAHCRNTDKLEDARLTFAQKLRLAQAFSGGLTESHVGRSLEKLNAIRNKMAHRAEVPDLDSRLDDYLKAWAEEEFVQPKTARERSRYLRNTLIFQIAMIGGMADSVTYLQKSVSRVRKVSNHSPQEPSPQASVATVAYDPAA